MHNGMLWFDNSATSMATKIQKAIDYYKQKYRKTPDLGLAHPSMLTLDLQEVSIGDVKIILRAYRPVLPGHIWVGVGEADDMKRYRKELEEKTNKNKPAS